MPHVSIQDAAWLIHYDHYYRSRQCSQPLPVLRVRYADPQRTWLNIDPLGGSIAWREESSPLRRWLYNGPHKFDLPYLYDHRPLWDAAIILFSLGGLLVSVTTLVPAYSRLRRHANRLLGRAASRSGATAPTTWTSVDDNCAPSRQENRR